MGNIINAADLAFNGEEVKAVSEAIMEEIFAKPAITEFLTPYTGIKAKRQIAFLGRLTGLVGQTHTNGTCAPVENDATITNTEKFWNPAYIDDRFSECWDDLLETFFIYGTKNGVAKADLTSTDFATFFIERYQDAIAEMFHRLVWFGDTAADDTAGGGNFVTAGFVAKRWDSFDGIWKQLYAVVAADSARKTTDLSAKNAELTFVDQAFDATDTTNRVVTTMLQNLVFNSDYRLRDKADKIIIVTQSVADQYVRELEAGAANGIPVAFDYMQDGITVLKRAGITIYAFSFWDRMIQGYMRTISTELNYYLPHRAILTTKANLAFGTEEEGNLSEVDVFFDKKDKKTYFDFGANLDAKVLQDYMVQVAY
tara:strand:- start:2838 stop:3944 length:1107 start_codon:yes stop_codon:yes gene_type:complete